MSRVLITGHKGYIGSHLFSKLESLGYEVEGVDLKEGADMLHMLPNSGQYHTVFHMAALPQVEYSVQNPSYALMHNVLGTSRLLEWALRHGVKRVVFSSSCAIYGDGAGPTSPYGLHKFMSERECQLYSELYGLDTVCLRYYNVYSANQPYKGAYSTVISAWLNLIQQGKPLEIHGDGKQTRDFIHVDDIVDANVFCMKQQQKFQGKAFDVGTGKFISLNDIKKIVEKYYNVEWRSGRARAGDIRHACADISALAELGWTSTIDSHQGIEDVFSNEKDY
jgi:UDP-glucose 4-epimerase